MRDTRRRHVNPTRRHGDDLRFHEGFAESDIERSHQHRAAAGIGVGVRRNPGAISEFYSYQIGRRLLGVPQDLGDLHARQPRWADEGDTVGQQRRGRMVLRDGDARTQRSRATRYAGGA